MGECSTNAYVKLTKDILVPSEWPLGGIDSLVLTLAKKIIDRCDNVSPILQVKDIPAKLVIRKANNNFVHVFEKVSKADTIGAYVYEIVLPKEEGSIRKRVLSGSNPSNESWPDYAVNTSVKTNKISYYLMPPRLDERALFYIEASLRAWRRPPRVIERRKMTEYFTVKNAATSTNTYLDMSSHKITYAKIHSAYATSLKSVTPPVSPLVRAHSWTSVASPQKKQSQERKILFEFHLAFFELNREKNDDVVLRKGQSDQSIWRNE